MIHETKTSSAQSNEVWYSRMKQLQDEYWRIEKRKNIILALQMAATATSCAIACLFAVGLIQ